MTPLLPVTFNHLSPPGIPLLLYMNAITSIIFYYPDFYNKTLRPQGEKWIGKNTSFFFNWNFPVEFLSYKIKLVCLFAP